MQELKDISFLINVELLKQKETIHKIINIEEKNTILIKSSNDNINDIKKGIRTNRIVKVFGYLIGFIVLPIKYAFPIISYMVSK